MSRLPQIGAGIGLIALCWVTRQPLEADPLTHMLVQMPVLAISGGLIMRPLAAYLDDQLEAMSTPLLLVGLFTIAFWMLPRHIDATLIDLSFEIAKFVSIPALIGGPIALAWPRTHPVLRGFMKANCLSMLGVLAFLYTHAPVRICNSYLVADQERLGIGFLAVAVALAVVWAVPLFRAGQSSPALAPTGIGTKTP